MWKTKNRDIRKIYECEPNVLLIIWNLYFSINVIVRRAYKEIKKLLRCHILSLYYFMKNYTLCKIENWSPRGLWNQRICERTNNQTQKKSRFFITRDF